MKKPPAVLPTALPINKEMPTLRHTSINNKRHTSIIAVIKVPKKADTLLIAFSLNRSNLVSPYSFNL